NKEEVLVKWKHHDTSEATWEDWLEFMPRFRVFVGHEDMSAVQGETNDTPKPSAAVQTKAAQDKARPTQIIKKPARYLEVYVAQVASKGQLIMLGAKALILTALGIRRCDLTSFRRDGEALPGAPDVPAVGGGGGGCDGGDPEGVLVRHTNSCDLRDPHKIYLQTFIVGEFSSYQRQADRRNELEVELASPSNCIGNNLINYFAHLVRNIEILQFVQSRPMFIQPFL
nr:hypothetical protein [Tanacetum cinerariifolium]